MGRLRALVLVGGLAAVLAVTGCGSRADRSELAAAAEDQGGASGDTGGGGGGETTTTLDQAEVEQDVTEVIEQGINGQNLANLEENLDKVENSDDPKVRATLEGIAANPTFSTVTAKVKGVEPLDEDGCQGAGVESPCAQASFDISLGGQVVLPDYKGYVVQQDGSWRLAQVSLCDLVALDPSIPQCA